MDKGQLRKGKEVIIHEEKVYCSFGITGKSKKFVYSDHNAFLITYDILDSDVKDYPKTQPSCMNSWKVTKDGLLKLSYTRGSFEFR